MERYTTSTDEPGRRKPPGRSNLFYGGLIVVLLILLIAICGIFIVLFTNPALIIFPKHTPPNTPTASSTATITQTPTVTSTATSSATFTNTSTAIASVTALPTRTATKAPAPTPKPSKTPTPIILKNTDYRITYQDWAGFRSQKAYKNGMRCSSNKDQVISYTTPVKAKMVAILFFKGPDQGKARIVIDGKTKETVDLYDKTNQYQFQRTYNGLGNKTHTIKVIVLGRKHPKSDGYSVCVDGFIYNNNRVNDSHRDVIYGPWQSHISSNTQNSYRFAAIQNAKFVFTFKGKGFVWVTATGPKNGLANIYVDHTFARTVDLYSLTTHWRKRIRVSGLSNRVHTVEIIVLGQKNPASRGTKVFLKRIIIP